MSEQPYIRWQQEDGGIVVLVLDEPGRSANTMGGPFVSALEGAVDRLEREKESITGVIITSAKATFFAGGDLEALIQAQPSDAAEFMASGLHVKRLFRRLETLGRPVVAAVNGSALGGGLEIALACHHRVVLRKRGVKLGLPEVTLGLLPGAGGVLRTVRLLGIVDALSKVLLEGRSYGPDAAVELGLADAALDSAEEVMAAARRWIQENPSATQPWDRRGYTIPGGAPADRALAGVLPALPAALRKQLKGSPLPAPRNILCAAVECAQVDIDRAAEVESRYFTELVTGQIAKNLTKAFFFDMKQVNSGASRPGGIEPWQATAVGVLGAGLMGAGIAYVCAEAGMKVVLKDVTAENAERGKAYAARVLDKAVARGRRSRADADAVLARIVPVTAPEELAGCDLVIEAVFEDPALKKKVFAEVQSFVAKDALLASNTSSLPITDLAEGVSDQGNFVGLHFFSPVERMPLLEIVVGRNTTDVTLARAFDVARQIGKTPIVVNDSRGFFTSRVIGCFAQEAVAMVGEGFSAATVEQAAAQAGYPIGALALVDDLTLTLMRKVHQENVAAALDEGRDQPHHPAFDVLDRLIDEFGRLGRASGGGFYDYDNDRRVGLWPGLAQTFGSTQGDIPFIDLQERMLFAEALEAVRCFEQGVVRSVADANVGSLIGIGYPSWTGGVLQYVDQYAGGTAGFLARSEELAARYGEQFNAPELLRDLASRGASLAAITS